jgi:hypothetical protein
MRPYIVLTDIEGNQIMYIIATNILNYKDYCEFKG